jgi:hypothetical protein
MTELELARTRGDRRLYALGGVGTLRLQGFGSRSALADAGGRGWSFARRGLFGRLVEAYDSTGTVVGSFEPRTVRRGGTVRWGSRELTLRPASAWRERYALAHEERELAVFSGKGWGRRPVSVTVDDGAALDPGLVLFTAFVVRGLAEDAGAAAGSTAAVT